MTTRTPFTDLVGCRLPIQLAAMPGINTPELVEAVANAGGLGMAADPLSPPEALVDIVEAVREGGGVAGVNFLVPFLDPATLDAVAPRVELVEFFWGDPDADLVRRARGGAGIVGWQVGSAAEAIRAAQAGCDYVVAQGVEAGGHVRGTTPVLELVRQTRRTVDVPVVAAGGIADPERVAEMMATGADAVRVGTAFIAAEESGAHPDYVQALLTADAESTVRTETFSVMWPDAPHRVLRTCVEMVEALGAEIAGEIRQGDVTVPVPARSVMLPTRDTTGRVDAMAMYAGSGVGDVVERRPAAQIVADLTSML